MRRLFVLAAAAIAATSAVAEDPTDWSGVYLGVNGGFGSANTSWTFPFNEYYNTAPGQAFATNPSGALLGAHLGFNHQFGSWVAGIEGTVAVGTLGQTLIGGVSPGFPLDSFTTRVQDLATVTGRLGYTEGMWLIYGKGGFSTGSVNLSAISGPPGAGVTFSQTQRLAGWTIGAGIEKRTRHNVVLGLEYNYTNLSGARFTTTHSLGGPVNVDLGNVAINSVMARVSFELNKP